MTSKDASSSIDNPLINDSSNAIRSEHTNKELGILIGQKLKEQELMVKTKEKEVILQIEKLIELQSKEKENYREDVVVILSKRREIPKVIDWHVGCIWLYTCCYYKGDVNVNFL